MKETTEGITLRYSANKYSMCDKGDVQSLQKSGDDQILGEKTHVILEEIARQ